MNTGDFIKSFNSDDIQSVVTNYFEEIMVLYRLIGHRQDLDICTDNESTSATFILLMDNEADAESLYGMLNGTCFSVYGNSYDISMNLTGASINTTIAKVLS